MNAFGFVGKYPKRRTDFVCVKSSGTLVPDLKECRSLVEIHCYGIGISDLARRELLSVSK